MASYTGLPGKLQRLQTLCQQVLANRDLIMASNRGPLEFKLEPGGELTSERGGGGVVTALSAISRFVPVTWIASAMSEGDRKAAEEKQGRIETSDENIYVRFV